MIILLSIVVNQYRWRNTFFFSLIFGIPAIVVMLVFMFTWPNHMTAPQVGAGLSVENLVMFLLATPVQVGKKAISDFFIHTVDV